MFFTLIKLVLKLVAILVVVAFVTLLEQKIIGLSQFRKGPLKVGYLGLLQPFGDAVKLLRNTVLFPTFRRVTFYVLSPGLTLFLAITILLSLPLSYGGAEVELNTIFLLCVLGAGVYPILLGGWGAGSKYPLLGGIRAVAQTISYEVILALVFLTPLILVGVLRIDWRVFLQERFPLLFYLLGPGIIWFIATLAELNRTPFDLREGERELVSGFNTEYRATYFVLFFLAEYCFIVFLSLVFGLVFLFFISGESLVVVGPIVIFAVVWVRRRFPRVRYDKLMELTWKAFLMGVIFFLCSSLWLGCMLWV